jgi:hypothetical protein
MSANFDVRGTSRTQILRRAILLNGKKPYCKDSAVADARHRPIIGGQASILESKS